MMDSHKSEDPTHEVAPAPAEHHHAPKHESHPVSSAVEAEGEPRDKQEPASKTSRKKVIKNNVRKIRTEKMMSKAELARRAGMSTLTIDRVERGMPCRMDTKRKILEALGLKPSDRVMVFGEDD
jgi:DNA-binding XRE family transcriptional regulator